LYIADYQSWADNIDALKQRLLHVWHDMDQSVIDKAVDKWRAIANATQAQRRTSNN